MSHACDWWTIKSCVYASRKVGLGVLEYMILLVNNKVTVGNSAWRDRKQMWLRIFRITHTLTTSLTVAATPEKLPMTSKSSFLSSHQLYTAFVHVCAYTVYIKWLHRFQYRTVGRFCFLTLDSINWFCKHLSVPQTSKEIWNAYSCLTSMLIIIELYASYYKNTTYITALSTAADYSADLPLLISVYILKEHLK